MSYATSIGDMLREQHPDTVWSPGDEIELVTPHGHKVYLKYVRVVPKVQTWTYVFFKEGTRGVSYGDIVQQTWELGGQLMLTTADGGTIKPCNYDRIEITKE